MKIVLFFFAFFFTFP
ncbi:pheA operon leader peptide PheL [Enterobacter ludwigii]